ncbi:MAG TPA: ABC transporter permease [Polyangiaceae bacterium]|jgi:lipoprotein-releasing system permease protein|nr:ABC transporter permease [Polyangiaceae bacterium]
MPFEWFVALRYLRDGKGQTALILAAISVGIAVVVFLSALIGGLQVSLIGKTLGSQPHVTLRLPREAPRALAQPTRQLAIARNVQVAAQRLRSIDQWPTVVARIERAPGVTAVSAMVRGAAFGIRGSAKTPIVVSGVEPERFLRIIDLRRRITAGHFDVDGSNVTIGSALAAYLGVTIGDKFRITTTEGVEDTVVVAGIFSLGNKAIDEAWLFASLRHAQSLYALPGGATTIELKVADVFDAERIASEAQDRTGLEAESWMRRNAELLSGLSAQNSSKWLIEFFVVLAVALGIASVLIVSVVQKSRQIGILRAVGTSSRRVLGVFLIQGGVLGLVGSFIGSALGALLAKLFENLAREADGSPRFPVQLTPALFAGATLLATGIGVLAAVIPARRAARLDPAVAIRSI